MTIGIKKKKHRSTVSNDEHVVPSFLAGFQSIALALLTADAAVLLFRSQLSSEFMDFHEDIDKLSWYHYVPVINVLYDTMYDIPPTIDQLKETLNLMGLVSALMITMVQPLPFSYSYDDWEAAIARSGGDTTDYYRFQSLALFSFYALGVAMISSVIMLVAIGHTAFRGPDGQHSHWMLANWWSLFRIGFTIDFLMLSFGFMIFFLANGKLVGIMLPHHNDAAVNATEKDRLSGTNTAGVAGCVGVGSFGTDFGVNCLGVPDPAATNYAWEKLCTNIAYFSFILLVSPALLAKTKTYLYLKRRGLKNDAASGEVSLGKVWPACCSLGGACRRGGKPGVQEEAAAEGAGEATAAGPDAAAISAAEDAAASPKGKEMLASLERRKAEAAAAEGGAETAALLRELVEGQKRANELQAKTNELLLKLLSSKEEKAEQKEG